jgi:4-hydroxybenzoate polyprenyltransferase
MSFNRIVDRALDAKNPRTAARDLPAGRLSVTYARWFCGLNALAFVALAFTFNELTGLLSLPTLAILMGYSWTKRFTRFTHFVLGLSLALAPLATWIASTGTVTSAAVILSLAVLLWVAGFDILYSCQDHGFDTNEGLKNMVVAYGIPRALALARLLHGLSWLCLVEFGLLASLGLFYGMGVTLMGGLLIRQHQLVKADDLSRIDTAFFKLNGMGSVALCVLTWIDILV